MYGGSGRDRRSANALGAIHELNRGDRGRFFRGQNSEGNGGSCQRSNRIKSTTGDQQRRIFPVSEFASGSFKLTVSIAGFKTTEVSDVVIELDQRRTLNLTMDVGTQATTVSVRPKLPTVDLIRGQAFRSNGRPATDRAATGGQAFMTLVSLTAALPGAAPATRSTRNSSGPQRQRAARGTERVCGGFRHGDLDGPPRTHEHAAQPRIDSGDAGHGE